MEIKYNVNMPHEALKQEFLKVLKEKRKEEEALIGGYVLPIDEYAFHVGYLRALKDNEDNFLDVFKVIFPST